MNPTLSTLVSKAIVAERLDRAERRRLARLAARTGGVPGSKRSTGTVTTGMRGLRWRRMPAA
jgi:hypothetical protein